MIDTSVPAYPLYMYKEDTDSYPSCSLPEGYRFLFYRKGDELYWSDIMCSLGFFETRERALEIFERDFISAEAELSERMLFVVAPSGEYVATCTLWDGLWLGECRQRFHWLGVKDSHAGLGIARALMTRLLILYRDLGYRGFLYLITGARYYPAVSIYRQYGFSEYWGDTEPGRPENEKFAEWNRINREILDERLPRVEDAGEGI